MKERQRWRPEEDAVLRAYVRQYGPREWHLVSQRMSVALDRDAKSCLERWKNYLRPGIKKGSLTDDEQRLVIRLQAKHGNKWKKIAAEVPGRTAKRLGKWWEVFKEKQQRELRDSRRPPPEPSPDERGRYEWLLENFAEKLVGERPPPPQPPPPLIMAGAPVLPPWLSSPNAAAVVAPPPRPPSPSVTLSLASAEAAWRLKRVEQQLEMEREMRRREVWEEFEAKMRTMRLEQAAAAERVEREHREKVAELRRDAQLKEEKMAEQWAAKHARVAKFLEQLGCSRPWSAATDMN